MEKSKIEYPYFPNRKYKIEYYPHKEFLVRFYIFEDGYAIIEEKLYCPKCKVTLAERKTLLFGYKYECIECEATYKTKHSLEENLMVVMDKYIQKPYPLG